MTNKDIIIHLITQELKYNRFILALRELGMEPQDYGIDLLDAILPLMEVPTPEGRETPPISDELADTYYQFLDKVETYPLDVQVKDLLPLAEVCYQLLVAQVYLESRIKIAE